MAEENLKHKTKIGLYWTALNNFGQYGLQFVVGIFMARMLSPEDYGITALPAIFIGIANVLIEAGFGDALVRKQELEKADLSTAFYYSILVGIFCYCTLFITAPWIAEFYDTPVLESLVRITALTFLWSPLTTPQTIILKRKLDFKTITKISISNKIIGSIVGIVLAYTGYGLWSLVIMQIVSSAMNFIQMWCAVRWLPTERWSKSSFDYLWNFGNKMMGVGILNRIYSNIVPIIVGKAGGLFDLGNLNRARSFAQLPSEQLTNILLTVTFPVLSKMQSDNNFLIMQYRRMVRLIAFVVFPIMLLLAVLAYPVVIILVGQKWAGCVLLLQILCIAYMISPVTIVNSNLLQVKGRTDITLKLAIIRKFVTIPAIIISLRYGIVVMCIVDAVLVLLSMCLSFYCTKVVAGVKFFEQVKDLIPAVLISIAMVGIVWGVKSLIPNLLLQVVVGGSVGVLSYILLSYVMKRPELLDVRYMLNRKK